MAKLGKESKGVVKDILNEPIIAASGGKAAEVQGMIDVLVAIGKKEKYISPTMLTKVAWGVIRDGKVFLSGIKPEPKEEDEEEDDDEITYYDEDELSELTSKELREEAEFFEVKLTKSRGGKKGKITGKARAKLIDAIMAQYPEGVLEEEEEEEEEEEDDDEEEVPWTRADLNGMTPKEVLEVAEAWEIDVPKSRRKELLKEKDYRWTVEAILTVQEGGDIEDIGADLYNKKELRGFEQKELEEIAKDWKLEPKGKKWTKKSVIAAILKFQKEELE